MYKLRNFLMSCSHNCMIWRYSVVIIIALLSSVSSYAQPDELYWDNLKTIDYPTYDIKTEKEGTKTVYLIYTPEDLSFIAHVVNYGGTQIVAENVLNGIIRLEGDIDMGAHHWRALGEGKGTFTGTFDGNGKTISNLYINGGNGDSNAGLIDVGGTNMCVKNLTIEDSYSEIGENGAILVGYLNSANNAKFENIKFINCRSKCGDKNGMISGYVSGTSGLTVSNILIDGAYQDNLPNVDGSQMTGGLFGWVVSSSFTIDNVRVQNTVIKGNKFVGGLIGEVKSSKSDGENIIKNCFVSAKFEGGKNSCGGIIGKMYNQQAVTIDNCIIDLNSNPFTTKTRIGGVVGFVNNGSYVTLKNIAILADKSKISMEYAQDQGLLVGCNWNEGSTSEGYINAYGCYIDKGYSQYKDKELEEKFFGWSIIRWRRDKLHYVNLYPYSSTVQDANSVAGVAKMNALGACFGVTPADSLSADNSKLCNPFMPLSNKEQGMIVGYTYNDSVPVTSAKGVGNDALPERLSWSPDNKMIMMKYGKSTTYDIKLVADKWLVEEELKNSKSNKRDTLQQFTAMPETTGVISGKYALRPQVKINESSFNEVKKSVSIRWTVDNYDAKIWKDAKWVIRRYALDDKGNMVEFSDTIGIDKRSWTDNKPVLSGSITRNTYYINLICPSLGYGVIPEDAASVSVNCSNTMSITAENPKAENGKIQVYAKIPNSQILDKSRVRLLKWETNQKVSEVADSTEYVVAHPEKYSVCEKTFECKTEQADDYLSLALSDDSSVNSCAMNHYVVLLDSCDNARLNSNSVYFAPQKDVSFTSFVASKGESTSKINLSWNVRNKTNAEMLFAVARRLYTAGDSISTAESDWDVIYTVDGTGGSMTYTDETFPGYVYQYRVRAYPKCESTASTSVWDAEIQDIGFASSRGTIMGTISYNGGTNYVEGVDVRLTPDSNTLADKGSAYSMYFNGDNDCLPLMPGMGESFWNGDWTIQFMFRPENNETTANGHRVMTLPGRFALNINADSLVLAGKKMHVNESSWNNHIVIAHNSGKYNLGFTGLNADLTETTTWVASVSDSEMTQWMKNQGETAKVDTLYFGRTASQLNDDNISNTFSGKIDEVRLWSKGLSDTELLNTYNRYIIGSETNLAAYYTFDSGVREYAFDSSHPKGKWNNRNTVLPDVQHPRVSNDIPGSDALSYRGVTDSGGNYQIAGVPFVGEGTNYMVVPVYGTHEFQPASIHRFVSGQSLTHSNVDFTDKSSFRVKVKACYALGNYPVKGLNILVDNAAVTDSQMMPITTDENGEAVIQVPIGMHKLVLAGDNSHTLLNNGLPCSVTGISDSGVFSFEPLKETEREGYMNFQADRTASVLFYDGSFVRLAGKIVGGSVERDKPIGFEQTNANLGTAQMVIQPQSNAGKYALFNLGDSDTFLMPNTLESDTLGNGNIQSQTIYKKGSSDITINVDPKTGEFLALVPPVNMKVTEVKTTGKMGSEISGEGFRFSQIPAAIDFNGSLYADTLRNSDKPSDISLFKYHAKKSYTNYSDPQFEMYNPEVEVSKDSLMHGSEYFVNYWTDKDNKEHLDSVALWSATKRDGSPESYLVKTKNSLGQTSGHPVFFSGGIYQTNMRLYERYTNRSTGRDSIYNINNVEFVIHNNLSTTGYIDYSNESYGLDSTKVDNRTIYTDKDGIVRYQWVAGYPNPSDDHTLSMSVTYTANGVERQPENGVIRGVVLGNVPIPGTNFVTAGPNSVSFVLRDPPGNASYSWIEKGSTLSHNVHWEAGWVGEQNESNNFYTGTKVQTFTGGQIGGEIQLSFTTDVENLNGTTVSALSKTTGGQVNDNVFTLTMSDKLQTSADPLYNGAAGDVYVGTSKNMTFSECNVLGFKRVVNPVEGALPTKDKLSYYLLGQGKSLAHADSITTMFAYSQLHILNELIPEMKKLRQNCVNEWVNDLSGITNDPGYYALIKHKVDDVNKDDDLWVEGKDYIWIAPENENSADSINIYNQWIKGWHDAIAYNEKVKYETPKNFTSRLTYTTENQQSDYGYLGNISLDAGTAQQSSITRTESKTDGSTGSLESGIMTDFTHTFHYKKILTDKNNKTTWKIRECATYNRKVTNTTTNTQTFGYYLHDTKPGNYFSVDVYLPGKLTGQGSWKDLYQNSPKFDEFFVFRTRGGQSKCPYLAPETSLYYKEADKNVTLNDGTIAIEDPVIEFEKHDILNVPAGESCFTTVKLSNKSAATVKLGAIFDLVMNQASNPYGLQFFIDGAPIGNNNSNQFCLLPGETVTKTLEIKQTDNTILNYDNVILALASDCEPAKRVSKDSIRVHFKPASSPVAMNQKMNIINADATPDTTAVLYLSGYNVNRPGFTGIRLKSRKKGDLNFETKRILFNVHNQEAITKYEGFYGPIKWEEPTNLKLNDQTPADTVYVKMYDWDEGTYEFLAESFTTESATEETTTQSDTLSILKDTKRPMRLVDPSPADGYYGIGSEISLQMNEDIQMENVTSNNFSVTAVLNDALVTHLSGLHFDGSTPAKTTSRVQVFDESTAFAFWYKPTVGKQSCLMSQTLKGPQGKDLPFKLFYNADATMSVAIGDTIYTNPNKKAVDAEGVAISDWMYAIVTYKGEGADSGLRLYNLFGTSNEANSTFLNLPLYNPTVVNANVPLYVGGSEKGDECHADIEQFVVYDEAESFEYIAAEKGKKQAANCRALSAYWPMDESSGLYAHDRIHSRDLKLEGTDNWYIPVTNYALSLNGENEYMAIKTEKCPVGKNEDYCLEFWFRADDNQNKSEMTMFSNGIGADETNAAQHASLSLGDKGQIILRASGQTREMGSGYNDGQWHHLAMNVQRDSYVTVLVDTVDVSSSVTLAGDDLGGFFNSQMAVGARRHGINEGVTVDNFFKGQLDEIRLWKAYRTTASVKQNAYTRLDGGEPGLIAYYPFEESHVVANQLQTNRYLGDRVKTDSLNGVYTADAPVYYNAGGAMSEDAVKAIISDNGPRLRAAGILTPLDINFTTNGKDKIVFSFPAELNKDRIEGCTINFSVRGLKDLAGNLMKESIDWCVYVNQNPLLWYAEEPSLKQSIGSQVSTKAIIYNNSSTTQNWNIVGLPSWLDVSQSSGSVGPFSSTTVTLSTVEGTATGFYQSTLYLVGNDNIYAPMPVSLSVTAADPGWTLAQTDGSVWMNIFGRLKINDNWADDENDIVGMFDDSGRCLALASPTYDKEMDSYFLYLNAKGNKDDAGKMLKFRVWEAKTGIIYEGADVDYWKGSVHYNDTVQKFINSSVLGDFSKPYVISAGKYIRQTLELHEGWNWFSLWVAPKAGNTADKVFGPISEKITEVKSRMGGTLPADLAKLQLYPANSYRVYMNEPATLTIEGEMQNPDNIQMTFRHPTKVDGVNWHWIGFPLWKMMTLSEAFADFNPVLNDVVKSEDAYAMYNGKSWVGNLKYLAPGAGYVYGYHYNNAEDAFWHYPNKAPLKADAQGFALDVDPLEYEDYTFVNVSVIDGAGNLINGFDYQLAAFTEDGACHGVGEGLSGESCPMSIFGDDGDVYSFKLFNKANGQTYELSGEKEYDNLTSPQSLRLYIITEGINDINADLEEGDWYNLGGAKQNSRINQRGVYVKQNAKKIKK